MGTRPELLAPHAEYAHGGDSAARLDEIRAMVKSWHEANNEVVLAVV